MNLITYECDSRGRQIKGYSFTADVSNWIEEMNIQYPDETYYVLNVIDVSYSWYKRMDGKLNGQ